MKVVTLKPPAVAVEKVRPPPGFEMVKVSGYLRITTPEPPVPPPLWLVPVLVVATLNVLISPIQAFNGSFAGFIAIVGFGKITTTVEVVNEQPAAEVTVKL